MEIQVKNVGKKFVRDWVFRNLNLTFKSGQSYAILGVNGSGKSTLLKVISGIIPMTEGTIQYNEEKGEINPNEIYKYLSFCAPYQELIEELTLLEFLKFHFKFKKLQLPSIEFMINKMNLIQSMNKEIKYFSSGMKQRVKLGLCFFSENEAILLDEPTTNLDKEGISWYQEQIEMLPKEKLVVVCSNRSLEYEFCDEKIFLNQYTL